MKILKYNFPLLLLSIICTITISIQAQTLYWQKLTDDYNVYDLLYDGQQNLYYSAASGDYYFFRSTDLGQTWIRLGDLRFYRIAMDSLGVLWGGSDSGIYKSTDQGETWTNTLPTNDRIFSITVSPNNWIWAGTLDGIVVCSSDHGNTWERDTIATDILWSIKSNNLNHIFAGSGNGKIYRTTNLGASWELVYSYQYFSIQGIAIDDSNVIYANRYNARLISSDNGITWTTIGGPSLYSLYLDKYHNFWAGLGLRSLDNCVSWTAVGPPAQARPYAFVDSLVFAGTNHGVFMYDPSFHPYIGNNYFPLEVGNKWQFNRACDNSSYEVNSVYYVNRDTLISDKKYYILKGDVNDCVRYDNDEDKMFLRWNDSDYVVMDYTLNEGSPISFILFNSHEIKNGAIIAPSFISIFDSSYHSRARYWQYDGGLFSINYKTYYSENLGVTKDESLAQGSGGYQVHCLTKMIRAILYDSTGVKYYSDHVKPTINFQPVFITNEFDLDWNFSVDHEYTYFENNGNENFVDSVLLYSYYSNDDSTFTNEPIRAENMPNTINYSISYLLDSTLMKNDYSFYYKIYAVDKGIVPEHSTKPDTGYYQLVYDPNVSVEIVDNKIIENELMQNYPNPFNPTTIIYYWIKEEGNVELIVYDVLGKVVQKLVDERKTAGNYSAQFDASNLSSGIYFYSLRVNGFVNTKKMLLIK